LNGIVIMDKPMGVTSFKALGMIKKAYGTKRVGHTGTLDPDATGVLPVLIGKATRAAELITASDKEYVSTILLGVRTDTLDLSGNETERRDVNVTENDILSVCRSFVGEIEQLPPMYSAISVNGMRLYDLARQGIDVEREKRSVTISSIEVENISLPEVTIRVRCSKGTYIRTLADDIGVSLGTLAAVKTLRRTATGIFTEQDAHSPEEIAQNPEKYILPIDSVFLNYKAIHLDERTSRLVKNGVSAYYSAQLGETFRVYDDKGEFIALSTVETIDNRSALHTVKGFY
jgi:tRNA pseudouridine55 synthase